MFVFFLVHISGKRYLKLMTRPRIDHTWIMDTKRKPHIKHDMNVWMTLRQVSLVLLWVSFTYYSKDLFRNLFCHFSRTFPRIYFKIPSRIQSGVFLRIAKATTLEISSGIPPKTVWDILKGSPMFSRNLPIEFPRNFSNIPKHLQEFKIYSGIPVFSWILK